MVMQGLLLLLATIGVSTILFVAARATFRNLRRNYARRAQSIFYRRREWLEADFLTQAKRSGKPRGLEWVDCDFEDEVSFARDKNNGRLRALVGVTISFEAIPGGGMEEVEAVSNLRCATAVFRFHQGEWVTDGRAIFNLRPIEAIMHFRHELERVEG